jgi:hypothetical protein
MQMLVNITPKNVSKNQGGRERERERVHLENFNLRGTIFGWEKMSR